MIVIPAIDIIDGKCVRLSQGKFESAKVYSEDPVTVAKKFEGAGISHLHLVDLDGAKAGAVKNFNVLESIAAATNLQIDFSGGIKSEGDIEQALQLGATQVACGSLAVTQPDLFLSWLEKFGPETIILSADTLDGKIATRGWTESSRHGALFFIRQYVQMGVTQIICTDISRDGLLAGPNVELYEEILKENTGISLVASGGVAKPNDLEQLRSTGVTGVIVGKAIYENKISLDHLAEYTDAN